MRSIRLTLIEELHQAVNRSAMRSSPIANRVSCLRSAKAEIASLSIWKAELSIPLLGYRCRDPGAKRLRGRFSFIAAQMRLNLTILQQSIDISSCFGTSVDMQSGEAIVEMLELLLDPSRSAPGVGHGIANNGPSREVRLSRDTGWKRRLARRIWRRRSLFSKGVQIMAGV